MTTENAARRIAAVGLLTGVLALLAVPASAAAGTTERVSVDSAGNQENGYPRPWTTHLDLALSADGRFVAFTSRSTNLVPGDTNGSPDVFVQGIDFGTGQWVWEGPYNVDSTNNVYFASSTGTSRTFAFSPAPRVLQSLRVFTTRAGTLTRSDDAGQTRSQDVTTGSMQLVTTGWTRPSTTVTVSFTMGWSLGIDDITYIAAP
jgi:hypothetical protein